MSATGLLLSDDLLFISRIVGTARDLGLHLDSVKSSSELLERARRNEPVCVILDLANPGLKVADLIGALRCAEGGKPRVVAYGSHVDVAALRCAREAGCDEVLPRSKFVEVLSANLPVWFRARS
jgi:CheY-like chemotaxis protein